MCPRCGREVWTVVDVKVVANGRARLRRVIAVWLVGTFEELLPGTLHHHPTGSPSGWSEEA
jgi:hypothetical protein